MNVSAHTAPIIQPSVARPTDTSGQTTGASLAPPVPPAYAVDEQRSLAEGRYVDGERNGHWVERDADGGVFEGPYIDGKRNGHWVNRYADGLVWEGPWVAGERHGRWVTRFADGDVLETEWRNGSREGQSGVYQKVDGSRYPGRWSDGCFRDADGYAWVWGDGKTMEECKECRS